MIAAIYARKSTEQTGTTEEARSVARQIERATAFATSKGWTVSEEHVYVDDGVSGALFDKSRAGYQRLMAALERPRFQALVMSEPSRLGRESVATSAALQRITEAGVEVWTYLDGRQRKMDTAIDKAMEALSGFTAEAERESSSKRTHDALLKKAQAGHHVGGRVYGYKNVDVGEVLDRHGRPKRTHVVLEVLPEEAAIVRQIFTLYAEGDGITRIAKRLNSDGVAAPRAGTGSWAPSAVREILRRPLYTGRVVWNKSQKVTRRGTKASRIRPATEWLRREAPELRIVSEALWAAVEQRRIRAASSHASVTHEGRRRGRPPGADLRSRALLSGLAQCAACGGSLVALTRRHGTGAVRQRVALYGCVYHQKRGRAVCTNDVVIRQDRLDAVFLDALAEALDERVIARAVALALERAQRRGAEAPDQRAALGRERAGITTAMRHLLDAVKGGRATETLLAELATQEERAKAIDQQLAALTSRPGPVALDRTRLAARLHALGRDVRGVLAAGGPEARLLLQRVLNGRRVACVPFREPGRRGYRFRASGSYAGVLSNSNDMRGPNGIRTRVCSPPRAFSTVSGHCGPLTHHPRFKFGGCSNPRTNVSRRDCPNTRQLPLMRGARRDASGAKEKLARDGGRVVGA